MTDIRDRHVFVTGGASGIGRAMAVAFARAGGRVTIADVDRAACERTVAALRDDGVACAWTGLDVASGEDWSRALAEAEAASGPVDILCNNAGVIQPSRADGTPLGLCDLDERQYRLLVDVNVVGVFLGIRSVVPGMVARGTGHVVNTASLGGLIAPASQGAYCSTKFAVVALSEALRAEVAAAGVGVSVLCPGGVASSLFVTSARRREQALGDGVNARHDFATARSSTFEAMRAESVADRVIAGVLADELYILTHPEYAGLVEERFAAIRASFGESAQPGYHDPGSLMEASRNPAYAEAARR